jgi:hypothetical protein
LDQTHLLSISLSLCISWKKVVFIRYFQRVPVDGLCARIPIVRVPVDRLCAWILSVYTIICASWGVHLQVHHMQRVCMLIMEDLLHGVHLTVVSSSSLALLTLEQYWENVTSVIIHEHNTSYGFISLQTSSLLLYQYLNLGRLYSSFPNRFSILTVQ